jgi:hypothetical protein
MSDISGFELIRRQSIPALRAEAQEYHHAASGARHLHLAAEDNNNAFAVAFLTEPQDSTGVAHILEHTALCGSAKYPVRDPFFMMTRRSLNNFMNAFTSSDWTAYPFASTHARDFDNLLDVYLDAAFFPRLDELDFLQEGWRLEFAGTGADAPLVFKGVVFNEMKGAMSAPHTLLHHALREQLFACTTYHHNSGGDPARIPDLSWQGLREFHARHYHPANAWFLTYGNRAAAEHQGKFAAVLARFAGRSGERLRVPDECRLERPAAVTAAFALEAGEDPAHKTHHLVGWLLGPVTDVVGVLETHFLSACLLNNSAAPLRAALETTPLGSAPSELCGVDDSARELVFAAGLEGSEPEHAEAAEALILDVLRQTARDGLPRERLEAVLHQFELSQREITGDSFPFGLKLMLNALPAALHGGDPMAALDLDSGLAHLRRRIEEPDYIGGLLRRLLLDNPHRVRVTLQPDAGYSARLHAAEQARLAALQQGLTAADRDRIRQQAAALAERQARVDDPEILPRVTLADVAPDIRVTTGEALLLGGTPAHYYAQGTNGLAYAQLLLDLPALDPALTDLLPLYTECLTDVGIGARDYRAVQDWQARISGGVDARVLLRGAADDPARLLSGLVLSGKALNRNQEALAQLLQATLDGARFDELERLREIVSQWRLARESAVTDSGHSLALSAASAAYAPSAWLAHHWDGLDGLKRLKALDDSLADAAALRALAAQLAALHEQVRAAPRRLLLAGEAGQRDAALEAWRAALPAATPSAATGFAAPHITPPPEQQGFAVAAQVNFCARAWRAVPAAHPDAAVFTVLGPYLRNNFLHTAVREKGGAYGAGAGFDGDAGTFRMYSYRDPRLDGTLADFDAALAWMQDGRHEPRMLEEAILGVIADMDRPRSPAGEAIGSYYGDWAGRTPAFRRSLRQRLLAVTLDDLRRAAARLQAEPARTAVVGAEEALRASAQHLAITRV